MKSPEPLIAVVGSLESSEGRSAAAVLGRALADEGCRLAVYSNRPEFIERYVVRGYLDSGKALAGSIEVHYAQTFGDYDFGASAEHKKCFRYIPDPNPDWEISYYRSLINVDGLVLMGGHSSALVTGVLAVRDRMPLLAVAAFEGSARAVWKLLSPDSHVVSAEHVSLMGQEWSDERAAELTACLVDQIKKRRQEERGAARAMRRQMRSWGLDALMPGLAFLGAAIMATAALFWDKAPIGWFATFFIGTPLLAGVAGALMRDLWPGSKPRREARESQRKSGIAVLGLVAGVVSAVLFFLAQTATNPQLIEKVTTEGTDASTLGRLVMFELVIALGAGYGFERVFSKLPDMGTPRVDALEAPQVNSTQPTSESREDV